MSYKYKNVSDTEQSLIGVGLVAPDTEVETDEVVENPNFKYTGEGSSPAINAVQQPQENVVNEATLIEPTENKES